MALDKGETALAEVARRKAEQVDSESLDSFEDDLPSFDNDSYQPQNYIQHSRTGSHTSNEIPVSRQHPWQQEERSHAQQMSFSSEADYSSRSPQSEKKARSGQSSHGSRSHQQIQLSQTSPSPQVSRSHHQSSRSFDQSSRSRTVGFSDVPPPLPERRSNRPNRHRSDQHLNSQMEGLDLNSDLISDYTAALNDGGNWSRNDSRGDKESKSVNVIHFGVV